MRSIRGVSDTEQWWLEFAKQGMNSARREFHFETEVTTLSTTTEF